MGWRFQKRIHVLPGIGVNLSRSGASLSLGVRGYHVTLGHGRVRRTFGIPGTGVYYTTTTGTRHGAHTTQARYGIWIVLGLMLLGWALAGR